MTEFEDYTVAPFRKFLGPVYDAYRKIYKYTSTALVDGRFVSSLEGTPLPDVAQDRNHNFQYSVYGPVDNMVKAGIVGTDVQVKLQDEHPPITRTRSEIVRPVSWLPETVEMREHFVDMPFSLPTKLRASTVATRHS